MARAPPPPPPPPPHTHTRARALAAPAEFDLSSWRAPESSVPGHRPHAHSLLTSGQQPRAGPGARSVPLTLGTSRPADGAMRRASHARRRGVVRAQLNILSKIPCTRQTCNARRKRASGAAWPRWRADRRRSSALRANGTRWDPMPLNGNEWYSGHSSSARDRRNADLVGAETALRRNLGLELRELRFGLL
jgi:hypothetical protein